jgi:AcrR family transcriptional regulator
VPDDKAARSQQQRSHATQQRLLDATIECLIRYGWSGTTTTLVAEAAGVSRGAQLHHYPTKASLVLAAVDHLTHRRGQELRAEAAAVTGQRIEHAIDLLASSFTGPLFQATLEVWVAARTDPALRAALVPLEASLGRELYRLTVDLLQADDSRADVRDAIQATLELMRGLGVANLLSDDSGRRRAVLTSWTRHLESIIAEPAGTAPVRTAHRSSSTVTR